MRSRVPLYHQSNLWSMVEAAVDTKVLPIPIAGIKAEHQVQVKIEHIQVNVALSAVPWKILKNVKNLKKFKKFKKLRNLKKFKNYKNLKNLKIVIFWGVSKLNFKLNFNTSV